MSRPTRLSGWCSVSSSSKKAWSYSGAKTPPNTPASTWLLPGPSSASAGVARLTTIKAGRKRTKLMERILRAPRVAFNSRACVSRAFGVSGNSLVTATRRGALLRVEAHHERAGRVGAEGLHLGGDRRGQLLGRRHRRAVLGRHDE